MRDAGEGVGSERMGARGVWQEVRDRGWGRGCPLERGECRAA